MSGLNINRFLEWSLAILTGDDNKAKSLRNQQYAIAAFKTQIAHMEAEMITKEQDIVTAEADRKKVFVNQGNLMDTAELRAKYVENVIAAENATRAYQKALNTHKETLAFLRQQLELAQATGTFEPTA